MDDISSVFFFTKVKKPKKDNSSRKRLTQLDKNRAKFWVTPAPAASTGRPRPSPQKRKSKETLFEGMGISLVYSICQTEKGVAVGPNSAVPPVYTDEIVKYLKWVRRTSHLHMNCFVIAFGYLYRLLRTREDKGHRANEPLVFTRSNWKLLVITAIMIAQKFSDDESYFNNEFVKLLGPKYTIKQLNKMEVAVLVGLNWDCFFTPQEYQDYYRCIRRYAAKVIK